MNRHRQIVEAVKKEFINDLQSGKDQYIRAVVRQIDYEFRQYANSNEVIKLNEFANKIIRRLKVPAAIKSQIENDLETVQLQVAEVWKEYFETNTGFKISDREITNVIASYQVDFSEIDLSETLISETKKAVNKGTGYNDLRAALLKRNLGFDEVNTLSNTAIAQFDNAVHVENAKQAGVIYYLYDGVKHGNSRKFCIDHINRVYTLSELESFSNGQGIPVITSLGGYNCTHYLTALINYVRAVQYEVFNEKHFSNAA